jgi:Protein of unknown function (DUF2846)
MNRLLVAAAAALLAVSCAHAPARAEAAKAPTGIATLKPSSPENSLLVVYRNVTGFIGMGGGMLNTTLYVDNKPVGDMAHDTYAVIEVAPGEHMVSARSGMGESNLPVSVRPGDAVFAQMETSPSPKLLSKPKSLAHQEIEADCSLAFNRSLVTPAAAPAAPGSTKL